MQICTLNDRLFIFRKTASNDTDDMFIERCWFIVKNVDKYEGRFEFLEKLSHLHVSNKFLGVGYDDEIMKEIEFARK
jgi:hypothetical protein